MTRDGLMRYREDLRPVVRVSLAFGASLLPFLVAMPLPVLIPYGVFVLWIHSYGPYAQHNHAHLPVFHRATFNRAYDWLLSMVTGYPTALWELHHNRGHHRHFLTPEKDVARVTHPRTGRIVSRWRYALVGNLTIFRDSVFIGIGERAEGKKSLLGKLGWEALTQLACLAALVYWKPWLGFFFFIVPCASMAWLIWWESYPHHLHVPGQGVHDASVTIQGERFNRSTFNIGHHTAHHEKPTLHWSLLPARTEALRDRIPEVCLRMGRGPGHMQPTA